MRLSTSALLLLPLAWAQLAHPHDRLARSLHRSARGQHARAGAVIPDGTLASISAEDGVSSGSTTSMSATSISQSSSMSPTPSSASSTTQDVTSVTPSISPSPTLSPSSVVSSASSSTDPASPSLSSVTTSVSPSVSPSAASPSPSTPTTLSIVSTPSAASSSSTTLARSIVTLITTSSHSRPSASSTAVSDTATTTKSGGLSHTALIVIIVVASCVVLAAVGWTAFRKWKLRPSNRFDDKMKPIDFSPQNDGLDDDFLEKTLHRSNSTSSAAGQRQQFVSELDHPNMLAGIPDHDFTAGPGQMQGDNAVYDVDQYNRDPYGHQQQYEYDNYGYQPQQGQYDHQQQHVYPPGAGHEYAAHDYPTQDEPAGAGYADVQRDHSTGGSGHGHGYDHGYPAYEEPQGQAHQVQATSAFPDPVSYLGRPTGGSDGPSVLLYQCLCWSSSNTAMLRRPNTGGTEPFPISLQDEYSCHFASALEVSLYSIV